MSMAPGTRIGAYEITALIGAGGMGEVYRAHDTRLNRDIALKILPDAFANDPDRLARFAREAQTLAALNHPNIAHIHGLEESGSVRALVMELVEGDDLSARIARGSLPLDEALPIARQIAEALQTAHDQGIIHRDLKPANIKVRPDGVVKVLDFGLAKLAEPESAAGLAEVTASPTITSPARMTAVGVVLGTAAYMSPEQAKGREADRRSDIWAFGCVLYEMLTGRRAFDTGSIHTTLAAVISIDPDWTKLPPAVPTAIERLLRRCLEKDPKRRLPHIAVAQLEIDDALLVDPATSGAGARAGSARRIAWPHLWPLVGVGVTTAVLGGLATWAFTRAPTGTPSAVARFSITLPSALALRAPLDASALAVSSDGTRLVYVADPQSRLVVRAFEQLDDVPLPGIVDARDPFFSDDGRSVGFFDSGVALRRVSIRGGPPALVCGVSGTPRGASWDGDTIVFATTDESTGLLSVRAGGGEPKVLTKPNAQDGEHDHSFPSVLPGGRSALFTIDINGGSSAVAILDLETGRYKRLLRGGRAQYLETGHVIYQEGRTLWAVGFDLATQQVRGDPVPVIERLLGQNFSVSRQGVLVYAQASAPGGPLVWVSRDGREEPTAAPPRTFLYPRLSPNGVQVAARVTEQELHIWVWDFSRQTLARLTSQPGQTTYPLWSPNGQHIIFTLNRTGAANLWRRRVDSDDGTAEQLTHSSRVQIATAMTPDGSRVVYQEQTTEAAYDLKLLTLADPPRSEALLETPADEKNAELSADGRWLAYESDLSGQTQIYVSPFPNVRDGKVPISTNGGRTPVWEKSGRELFFVNGTSLMVVEVQLTPTFAIGRVTKLFESGSILFDAMSGAGTGRTYDVSRDGQRFLMVKATGSARESDRPADLVVVQNWFEELKRLVPTR